MAFRYQHVSTQEFHCQVQIMRQLFTNNSVLNLCCPIIRILVRYEVSYSVPMKELGDDNGNTFFWMTLCIDCKVQWRLHLFLVATDFTRLSGPALRKRQQQNGHWCHLRVIQQAKFLNSCSFWSCLKKYLTESYWMKYSKCIQVFKRKNFWFGSFRKKELKCYLLKCAAMSVSKFQSFTLPFKYLWHLILVTWHSEYCLLKLTWVSFPTEHQNRCD